MKYILVDNKSKEYINLLKGEKRQYIGIDSDNDIEIDEDEIDEKELYYYDKLVLINIENDGEKIKKKLREKLSKGMSKEELRIFFKYEIDLDRVNGQLNNLKSYKDLEDIEGITDEDVKNIFKVFEELEKDKLDYLKIRDYYKNISNKIEKENKKNINKIQKYIMALILEKIGVTEEKLKKDIIVEKNDFKDADYRELYIYCKEKIVGNEKVEKNVIDIILKNMLIDNGQKKKQKKNLKPFQEYLKEELKSELKNMIKSEYNGIRLENICIYKFAISDKKTKLRERVDKYIDDKENLDLISKKAYDKIKKLCIANFEIFNSIYYEKVGNRLEDEDLKRIVGLICKNKNNQKIDVKADIEVDFEIELEKDRVDIQRHLLMEYIKIQLEENKFFQKQIKNLDEYEIKKIKKKQKIKFRNEIDKMFGVHEDYEYFKYNDNYEDEVEKFKNGLMKNIFDNFYQNLKTKDTIEKEIESNLEKEIKKVNKMSRHKKEETSRITEILNKFIKKDKQNIEKKKIIEMYLELEKEMILTFLRSKKRLINE